MTTKNLLLFITLLSSPIYLFSAGATLEGSDFIPRVVNFIIFITILYYLVFDKLVAFFKARKEDIQQRLQIAQEKLTQSKKVKADLKAKIKSNEKLAIDIIKNAEEECNRIHKNYEIQNEQLLMALKKSYDDKMSLDKRSLKINITTEVLENFISDSLDELSGDQITNLINYQLEKAS